mmetsp:Transcript_99845/g.282583  ORF Transcript_99845/g.282583 Transcript_99845/m.282583 type:complete len:255 (+) Transcript_99845:342-1106(+)
MVSEFRASYAFSSNCGTTTACRSRGSAPRPPPRLPAPVAAASRACLFMRFNIMASWSPKSCSSTCAEFSAACKKSMDQALRRMSQFAELRPQASSVMRRLTSGSNSTRHSSGPSLRHGSRQAAAFLLLHTAPFSHSTREAPSWTSPRALTLPRRVPPGKSSSSSAPRRRPAADPNCSALASIATPSPSSPAPPCGGRRWRSRTGAASCRSAGTQESSQSPDRSISEPSSGPGAAAPQIGADISSPGGSTRCAYW